MSNNKLQASLYLSKYTVTIPSAIETLASQKTSKILGKDYEPLDCDIVCGRGKGSYNRPGNKHFRSIVTSFIPTYIQSKTKIDKTTILNTIIEQVRSQHDAKTGRNAQFIKHSKREGWIEIGDEQAREKVGHAIREAMAAQRGENPAAATKKSKKMRKPVSAENKPKQEVKKGSSTEVVSMEELSGDFSEVDLAILQARLLPSAVGSRSSFTLFDDLIGV